MRLTGLQLTIIRDTVLRCLGEGTGLWLFGSRADDRRRGGEVDLYVETPKRKSLREILRCKSELEENLDLHVDLLAKAPGEDKPILRIARDTGVRL